MTEYKITLDYDYVPRAFVERERAFSSRRFKLPFEIWESSPGSYHLRCPQYVTKEIAFKVLNASFCSEGYKELCRKRGDFPASAQVRKSSIPLKARLSNQHLLNCDVLDVIGTAGHADTCFSAARLG